ncbi:MAG TPA: hypothetical protein PKW94_00155 [Candidatus Dojkabacteria bacterium]|nr:hypothetical protein [Candidatus Dojkabacteria bacterium]HOR05894.1 hypothetical protein [Candidatus Dojkabacteria bacterium]HOT60708.1 hypothetical protein [Candidatus Dojkabacteria bacterium]HQI92411.1 hypothetical protein [Candidatus Dojkabacteria bacterium]
MQRLFKIFGIFLLLLIFLFIFLTGMYLLWEREFSSNLSSKSCVSNNQVKEISFDERIRNFVFSSDRSDYIQFTKGEILYLISSELKKEEGDIVVKDMCVDSSKGVWKVYLNLTVAGIKNVWFIFDIIKDDRETAELYVDNLYLGNFYLPSFISSSLKEKINKGISDAIVLVNENSFSGRSITNIELLEEDIVVKGVY